jgi:hypothetical protein
VGKVKPTLGGRNVFWPKEKVFEEAKFEELKRRFTKVGGGDERSGGANSVDWKRTSFGFLVPLDGSPS